jgi:hypothetical protein
MEMEIINEVRMWIIYYGDVYDYYPWLAVKDEALAEHIMEWMNHYNDPFMKDNDTIYHSGWVDAI